MIYYAHSANKKGQWQTQHEHISEVTRRAEANAELMGLQDQARLAGLFHDIGKYSDLFAKRLKGEAHKLDHWSAGAWIALRDFQCIATALAIQGHHIGLQKGDPTSLAAMDLSKLADPDKHPLQLRLTETDTELLNARLTGDGFQPMTPATTLYTQSHGCASMLDVRMLFSALVDADFLDTEAHFRGPREEGIILDAERAFTELEKHVAKLEQRNAAAPEIMALRADLWDTCIQAGALNPGLFTLTAPTGAGKTLAMLGFALKHALHHPLSKGTRRIIMVVPYLTITDQTARVYRDILWPVFGKEVLIEHHSLAGTRAEPDRTQERDLDDENNFRQRERQLAENWDAPVIVTTSIQFLESLHSNRPSACRKLHRLAHSVILMDEVQTLPRELAIPTLATLSHLSQRYGATVVLSTATQPAFSYLDQKIRPLASSGWQTHEIVPVSSDLFPRVQRARRTLLEWPVSDEKWTWEQVAERMANEPQALCIVNLKRHARELITHLQKHDLACVRHLSTSMCPAHRRIVLDEIVRCLDPDNPQPCHLASTQCIEAGIDLDAPVLYRAFGPLEAIAQASGRCNRAGKRPFGRVVVFHPADAGRLYPDSAYESAAQVTQSLLKETGKDGLDIYMPETFARYYQRLYDLTKLGLKAELEQAIEARNYVEVARHYRLIEEDSINVLVPYCHPETEWAEFETLVEQVRDRGITADWIRRARPYSVNVFRPKSPADPIYAYLENITVADGKPSEDWFIYTVKEHYDPLLGLMPPPSSHFWHA
jgi:CRISPR-associated endonuclease Cas3-HD